MKTGIFIRCAYNDAMLPARLMLLQSTIECLKQQVYKDFDVFIIVSGVIHLCNKAEPIAGNYTNTARMHALGWGDLSPKFIASSNPVWKNYNIQIRLDSDDYISPLFVARCVQLCRESKEDDFIVMFHPYFLKKGVLYKQSKENKYRYCETFPSAFSAMIQKKEVKHFIHNKEHHRMYEMIPLVKEEPFGMCLAKLHDSNLMSVLWKGGYTRIDGNV